MKQQKNSQWNERNDDTDWTSSLFDVFLSEIYLTANWEYTFFFILSFIIIKIWTVVSHSLNLSVPSFIGNFIFLSSFKLESKDFKKLRTYFFNCYNCRNAVEEGLLNVITFDLIIIDNINRMETITYDFYLVICCKWDAWFVITLAADNTNRWLLKAFYWSKSCR